jgi:hypothetical protein
LKAASIKVPPGHCAASLISYSNEPILNSGRKTIEAGFDVLYDMDRFTIYASKLRMAGCGAVANGGYTQRRLCWIMAHDGMVLTL